MNDRDQLLTSILASWFGMYPATARAMLVLYRAKTPVPASTLAHAVKVKRTALSAHLSYIRSAMTEGAIPHAEPGTPRYRMSQAGKDQIAALFERSLNLITQELATSPPQKSPLRSSFAQRAPADSLPESL